MRNTILKKVLFLLIIVNLGIVLSLSSHLFPFEDSDTNDYIESARNLREGRGLTHYVSALEPVDTDREALVFFPPGFPIMIAGLTFLGMDATTAAVVIPRLCFIILPVLLFFVLRFIGGDAFAIFITAATIFMKATVYYSFWAMSDVPFLAMALLCFLLLFQALQNKDQKGNSIFYYAVISGLVTGWALAIRNVGYSIPLAVSAGLTLGAFLRLISWKFYLQTLTSYGSAFVLAYSPFLLRNLMVFHTWQPYVLDPSELSFLENVRYYILALEKSFVHSFGDYTRFAFMLITGILVTSLVVLFRTKQFDLIRNKYPDKMLGAFILIFYLVLGSAIVILGRSKYQWGEYINMRHLLQYNWIFLAGAGGVFAIFYRFMPRHIKINFRFYALAGLIIFIFPQAWMLSVDIKDSYSQEGSLSRIQPLYSIGGYLKELPEKTYLISTTGPFLRILFEKPVRWLPFDISPEKLADVVCSRRPLAVILEKAEMEKYVLWQDAFAGKIPDGYQVKASKPDFMILLHP